MKNYSQASKQIFTLRSIPIISRVFAGLSLFLCSESGTCRGIRSNIYTQVYSRDGVSGVIAKMMARAVVLALLLLLRLTNGQLLSSAATSEFPYHCNDDLYARANS